MHVHSAQPSLRGYTHMIYSQTRMAEAFWAGPQSAVARLGASREGHEAGEAGEANEAGAHRMQQ